MSDNKRSVSLRFNLDDKSDMELYNKLEEGAKGHVSLTAYIKKILEEYYALDKEIVDRQKFHEEMICTVREEMNTQGLKMISALLSRIDSKNIISEDERNEAADRNSVLPEKSEEFPDDLSDIIDWVK